MNKYKLFGIAIVAISVFVVLGVDKALANCTHTNDQFRGNCATFISQYVPGTVIAGNPFEATVIMQNTGTGIWSPGPYKLSSQNPQDNQTWGANRWQLLAPVPPGATANFVLNLRAPSTPGQYNFQTRMVDDTYQHFGAFTPNRVVRVEAPTTVIRCADGSITQLPDRCTGLPQVGVPGVPPLACPAGHVGAAGVCIAVCPSGQIGAGGQCITPPPAPGVNPNCSDCAEFVSQNVPTTMFAGLSYPITITEKNTGMATWTATQLYRLGAINPNENTTWGTARVELPHQVPSGSVVTFAFPARAPATPGVYNFQWSMVHDGVWWFGGTTPNVAVTVIPPTVEALQTEINRIVGQIISLLPTPCPNPQIGVSGVICQTVPPPPSVQAPFTYALTDQNNTYAINVTSGTSNNSANIRVNGVANTIPAGGRVVFFSPVITKVGSTSASGLTASASSCPVTATQPNCISNVIINVGAGISGQYIVTFISSSPPDTSSLGSISYTVNVLPPPSAFDISLDPTAATINESQYVGIGSVTSTSPESRRFFPVDIFVSGSPNVVLYLTPRITRADGVPLRGPDEMYATAAPGTCAQTPGVVDPRTRGCLSIFLTNPDSTAAGTIYYVDVQARNETATGGSECGVSSGVACAKFTLTVKP